MKRLDEFHWIERKFMTWMSFGYFQLILFHLLDDFVHELSLDSFLDKFSEYLLDNSWIKIGYLLGNLWII